MSGNSRKEQQSFERERRYRERQQKLENQNRQIWKPVVRRKRQPRIEIPELDNDGLAFRNLFGEEIGNMAGQAANQAAPQFQFDNTDPTFQTLSAAQQACVNTFLSQQLSLAGRAIRVANLNTSIEVPKYDERRMTAETFFSKCKNYLGAQGYADVDHHLYLPVIMKGEMKLWYDSVASSIQKWDDFKDKFKARYDNPTVQMERSRQLHSRRQGENDPCEQFIYEMVNLAKQVDPTEPDSMSLKRARDALNPQISALVGELNAWTIENLLERVSEVHTILHRQSRKVNHRAAEIPPLKGLREELQKRKSEHEYGNNRSYHSRGRTHFRGGYQNQGNRSNYRDYRPNNSQNSSNNSQSYSQNRGSFQHGTNRSSHNSNTYRGRSSARNPSNTRGRQSRADIKCHKCGQFGHYVKECNSPNPIVMAAVSRTNYQSQDVREPQ
ncbi:Activity-regulated cytoskeleton-associated protein [Folsomia candida]|uniref:Activity-regulated cytoskeleton-associated protein n=1 Tax=Folsomia candida TaxID=158441 RepID=A0A226CYS8_FOLCA|nr:Activity-regulated cytoskeleton-associated protein [Folsomia candida]